EGTGPQRRGVKIGFGVMQNLTIADHPLLRRDLTILRDRRTPHGVFRERIANAASILAYEAMRDLRVRTVTIDTPLESAEGVELDEEVFVVPILRAGRSEERRVGKGCRAGW